MGEIVGIPERLSSNHALDDFNSGTAVLDDWLRRRARHNEAEGASRTYVVSDHERVVGYYSLATGSVASTEAPGRVRRNMPDQIPVMVLGRLAVDLTWQGRGLGSSLLQDAILRTLAAADIAGVRALLVHAISPDAKAFYRARGFIECPGNPMTLLLLLKDVRTALS